MATPSRGQAQTPPVPPAIQTPPPNALPTKPLPVPTGVIPLPQSAPPTGLQAPLPRPALPLTNPDQPRRVSPGFRDLNALLQNHTLTINEAVALTLATNRSFATAVSALRRAQGRTGEARASLNPTLGAGAQITEYDQATVADFSALGGGSAGNAASTPPLIITPQFNPIITVTGTLPLDLFGVLRSAASEAQFLEVAARIDINRVRNQIVLDVKNAFYNVLRAQAQVAVANDNLNNSLARLSDAQKNYAAGTSPRFDVITAQASVADAQQQLIQARSQVSINLALLKNTIGIDIRTPLSLSNAGAIETPPEVTAPLVPPITPQGTPADPNRAVPAPPPTTETPLAAPAPPLNANQAAPKDPTGQSLQQPAVPLDVVDDTLHLGPEYEAALREALQTRPEILEAEASLTAYQRGVQFARRSSLPSFNVSLGYVYTPNATGFTRENVEQATLGVSLPIFDGGVARARVQQARADVASAETNRRQAIDQVGLEVQQAYLTLLQARDRVAVANVGLAQAREAFRLARVRYNAGVSQQTGISPQLELSNSQTSLTQAETNQVNALYDYNSARAQLDRAIGRYSYAPNAPGYPAPPSAKVTGQSRP